MKFNGYEQYYLGKQIDIVADWDLWMFTRMAECQNLIKFEGMQLPGGVTLNGRQLYDDAITEIDKLEEQMSLTYELPLDFMTG